MPQSRRLAPGGAVAPFHDETPIGLSLIINGRHAASVTRTVSELSRHEVVHGAVADLSTSEGAQHLLDAAAAIGAVDILVSNAGYFEVKPCFSARSRPR